MKLSKIKLQHPDPEKKTISMDIEKYNMIQEAVHKALFKQSCKNFNELAAYVENYFKEQSYEFKGVLDWHLIWVCMDMEARGLLEKDTGSSPYRYNIKK